MDVVCPLYGAIGLDRLGVLEPPNERECNVKTVVRTRVDTRVADDVFGMRFGRVCMC